MTEEEIAACWEGILTNLRQLDAGPYAGHWAGTAAMLFAVGVAVVDARNGHPITRWCYPSYVKAKAALAAWSGEGDPPGEWIKEKAAGRRDRRRVPDPYDRH